MIKPPPKPIGDPFTRIIAEDSAHVGRYVEIGQVFDSQGRYLPFDKLRFRFPQELDSALAWSVVKAARNRQLASVIALGEPAQDCRFLYTPAMHVAVSACDQNTTTAALEWMCAKIGENKQLQYLLKDLVEDEAISSSQLEGAATTTKVAKDLLKRSRGPRTADEKMIIGNFKMMQQAWQLRDKPLSPELITELHQVGVEGIDDAHYRPGTFRGNDDVITEDGEGNVVHQPPPADSLEKRLASLVEWVNSDHADMESARYIHPLIKAVIIHFAIGFEHPFQDGNGRVARSLFYWYLFKCGFSAFRYIAISSLLKAAPLKYGKSYLYTETDEMDLTYFIDYQCSIVLRAIKAFKENYDDALAAINTFNAFLYESGLYARLSDKQRVVFNVAKSGKTALFTANNVKDNLGCSYNTAAAVLNGLVDLNLFRKSKESNEWVYSLIEPREISSAWS